jgi:hypothetical protein
MISGLKLTRIPTLEHWQGQVMKQQLVEAECADPDKLAGFIENLSL